MPGPSGLIELAALGPLGGEVMIGVGTIIDDRNDQLISIRIIVHRPKIVRHHGAGRGSYRDRNYERQAGANFF